MRTRLAAIILVLLLMLAPVIAKTVPEQLLAAANNGADPTKAATSPATPIDIKVTTDPELQGLTRSDRGDGGAKASVAWLTPVYLRGHPEMAPGLDALQYLIFRVVVDSPALQMSTWDLKGMIYLREEKGKEYGTPLWKPVEQGARKVGLAAFGVRDAVYNPVPRLGSRYFEIVIRDLAGTKERVFRWNLQ